MIDVDDERNVDWIRRLIHRVDPFAKHGNHDQSSHGNWARGKKLVDDPKAKRKANVEAYRELRAKLSEKMGLSVEDYEDMPQAEYEEAVVGKTLRWGEDGRVTIRVENHEQFPELLTDDQAKAIEVASPYVAALLDGTGDKHKYRSFILEPDTEYGISNQNNASGMYYERRSPNGDSPGSIYVRASYDEHMTDMVFTMVHEAGHAWDIEGRMSTQSREAASRLNRSLVAHTGEMPPAWKYGSTHKQELVADILGYASVPNVEYWRGTEDRHPYVVGVQDLGWSPSDVQTILDDAFSVGAPNVASMVNDTMSKGSDAEFVRWLGDNRREGEAIWAAWRRFTSVKKHGNHDQKSHGNWARGGGGDTIPMMEDFERAAGTQRSDESPYDIIKPGGRSHRKDLVSRELADLIAEDLTDEEVAAILDEDEFASMWGHHPGADFDRAYQTAKSNEINLRGYEVPRDYVGHFWEVAADEGIEFDRATDGSNEIWEQMSDRGKARVIMYTHVNDVLGSWATTALDHDPKAYNLQLLGDELFPGDHSTFKFVLDNENFRPPSIKDNQRVVYGKVLQASYDNTQKFLKSTYGLSGDDTVTLYRGFKTEAQENDPFHTAYLKSGGQMAIAQNPLSSWTLARAVAEEFADPHNSQNGYVFKAEVPVSQIASTAMSGLGALHEYEFIVNVPDGTIVEVDTWGTD